MKFRYRIVGIGCGSKRRVVEGDYECSSSSACYKVVEGDYECSSSSACYKHACDLAIMDHSIYRIISISVICPPSEAFPLEVI